MHYQWTSWQRRPVHCPLRVSALLTASAVPPTVGETGEVLALARDGPEVAKPSDVIKDPFVLEFLELREHAKLHKRDVEQAIIDRLETFLLELGKGFSFVGRQVRLTVEGDHFYVDLGNARTGVSEDQVTATPLRETVA